MSLVKKTIELDQDAINRIKAALNVKTGDDKGCSQKLKFKLLDSYDKGKICRNI